MSILRKRQGFKFDQVKDHIQIAGKVVLKSVGIWALISVLGSVVSLISFLISFLFTIELLFVDDFTFLGYIEALFSQNLPAFIGIFGLPIFIIVYVIMAKKVSIQYSIYWLFQSKSGEQLLSILSDAVQRITQKTGGHSEVVNKAILKIRVLQEMKENPETSGFQRSLIQYGFRKVNLDDVDFQDENSSLSAVLTEKFSQFFAEMIQPSLRVF